LRRMMGLQAGRAQSGRIDAVQGTP
jgi:hypothetical protein